MEEVRSRLVWFDPGDEQTFTLNRGHKEIEATYSTLRRYAYEGARAASGGLVQLEVCKTPPGLATTLGAYRRFISRLSLVIA